MRALIWITEDTWQACVDQARLYLPADAEVTLLHVAPADVEQVAAGGARGLLGRRPPPPPGPPLRAIAEHEAQALLRAARERLKRPATLTARRGRVEHEVVAACAAGDLLIAARDGDLRAGPKSLGPRARFVVDHAPCQVLLVWAGRPAVDSAKAHPLSSRHQ
ncbi:MAG: universal stress protein [Solirubrobacteraceae bacterium]|jgi:nucleotide-binding universal stress UspA family protein